MKILPSLTIASLLFFSAPSFAEVYDIDYSKSTLTFSGNQAGKDFTGHFNTWSASIDFAPDALADSHISATFDTASAKTGDPMLDSAMPKADWFHSKSFPQATFTSQSITANDDGSYTMTGLLRIRDQERPVTIPFTLSDLSAAPVNAKASFTIDRTAYGIGMDSDPSGEWVDKSITITLDLTANTQ
ncbi:MAG: polyisoprenoid-binding protein [Alphaproteobacteria bacterium]|nr:polyisoprenoid-binding protein [Alphaproteobacteria bacterium]HCQ70560.1 polyisoprenoid-binding protein [Rhodospirillaceae bacterium]|tara:strand:+ start:16228 stop:16788 length:561 start_codon:yes stop_codon:yes gene_type:complete